MSGNTDNATTDYRKFADYPGLAHFWENVKKYMTVDEETVLAGKQLHSIKQVDGRVIVTMCDFGGDTEEEKEAARQSLGVISAEALEKKADKVEPTPEEPSLEGKLPVLDAEGNLGSSGVLASDILVKQSATSVTSDSGYTVTGMTQDEYGRVTLVFSPIREAGEDPETGEYVSGLMTAEDKEKLDNIPSAHDIEMKADKVVDAVAGNIAALDSTGNLVDSGIPGDINERLSFIENHMLQTKSENNDPNSGILKLFRGPLPREGWTEVNEP